MAAISQSAVDPVGHPRDPRARRYEVLHVCDSVRDIAEVVDAQITAGIRPFLLSRVGESAATQSLIQTWNDVRGWRRLIEDYGSSTPAGSLILHAHSFAAGMASVRSGNAVVYDLRRFIEQSPGREPSAWLDRSFRAAEQFVLSQAHAIVAHDAAMHRAALARGARATDLFIVPPPFASEVAADSGWLHRTFGLNSGDVVVYAGQCSAPLLEAFGMALTKVPGLRLVTTEGPVHEGRSGATLCLPRYDAQRAIASSAIVVTGRADEAVAAMQAKRALIAFDCVEMREITPDGRGCLWTAGPAKELANRIVYLAEDVSFRAALGESGYGHLHATRSPERIGRMYEEIYRHARARHLKGSKPQDPAGRLVPAHLAV